VTGLTVSLTLGILIVGLPVVMLTIRVNRWLCDLERRRAALVLGAPIPAAYRPPRRDGGWLSRLGGALADPQTWKDLGWLTLVGPIGLAGFILAVTAWATVISLVAMPAWYWSLAHTSNPVELGLFHVTSLPLALLTSAIGLVLVPVAAWLVHVKALADAHLARLCLQPTDRAALAARVERLTETRAGAVDAAHVELTRIERDLHDGAQARLVALAMDLGMAERKLDSDDPTAARELMGEARDEARRALAELRDLVRGIGPSILRDRGLDAALTSLVAGRTPAVDLRVDVPIRPASATETAAYFVVAETLTNVAKHSGGQHVSVRAWVEPGPDGRLVVEVSDDGRGGADPRHGSGLAGLAKRIGALDGAFTVTSPQGGPTTIRAELPCAS
jgi:signal transduction histidine kinase